MPAGVFVNRAWAYLPAGAEPEAGNAAGAWNGYQFVLQAPSQAVGARILIQTDTTGPGVRVDDVSPVRELGP